MSDQQIPGNSSHPPSSLLSNTNVSSATGAPITASTIPVTSQMVLGQPVPQMQVTGMAQQPQQYVQLMLQNPALAMQTTNGINFAMAQPRPPAAHTGSSPRGPMLGIVPPSSGTAVSGMQLVPNSPNIQSIAHSSASPRSPIRSSVVPQNIASVMGQRLMTPDSIQQLQQQQRFLIRPFGMVTQHAAQTRQNMVPVQSPIGTVAPTTQHHVISQTQIGQQITTNTGQLIASQPAMINNQLSVLGQLIQPAIPVAHQQYITTQGQQLLGNPSVRPPADLQGPPLIQNIGPIMAARPGRPRLENPQRKTPPGVSLAVKRSNSTQARITPIASRGFVTNISPMNYQGGAQNMMKARMKHTGHGYTDMYKAANLVKVPNPNLYRDLSKSPKATSSTLPSTKQAESVDIATTSNEMPKLTNLASQGDGLFAEKEIQKAIVKPQTLTHFIDGFVIEEGPLPFPVQPSSLMTDASDPPPKLSKISSQSEDDGYRAESGPIRLKCEFCGKVDLMTKFRRSKRFCSVACAKRYNVACSRRLVSHKSKGIHPGSSIGAKYIRKKKQMLMKKGWKRGQGSRLMLQRHLHGMDAPADDEHSTSSNQTIDDSSSAPSTPNELSQDNNRTNLAKWTVQEVYEFVRGMPGCEPYADSFRAQEIDGQALMLLKEDHLMSAMNMKLGPALKICSRINTMKADSS